MNEEQKSNDQEQNVALSFIPPFALEDAVLLLSRLHQPSPIDDLGMASCTRCGAVAPCLRQRALYVLLQESLRPRTSLNDPGQEEAGVSLEGARGVLAWMHRPLTGATCGECAEPAPCKVRKALELLDILLGAKAGRDAYSGSELDRAGAHARTTARILDGVASCKDIDITWLARSSSTTTEHVVEVLAWLARDGLVVCNETEQGPQFYKAELFESRQSIGERPLLLRRPPLLPTSRPESRHFLWAQSRLDVLFQAGGFGTPEQLQEIEQDLDVAWHTEGGSSMPASVRSYFALERARCALVSGNAPSLVYEALVKNNHEVVRERFERNQDVVALARYENFLERWTTYHVESVVSEGQSSAE